MTAYVMDAMRVFHQITGSRLEWSGLCIWFLDDVNDHAPELMSLGCRYSGKRGQWYWRHEEA